MNRPATQPGFAALAAMTGAAPYRVLLVDDDPLQRALATEILEPPHYQVDAVAGGIDAMACLETHTYDVILLDQHMPDVSGDDVCRHVRQVLGDAMLPIIVVTGSSSADQLERSFAAGATDFIRKPYQATELVARIESAVSRKRLTDQLDSAEEVMFALARMVEARDGETGDHCTRLAELAVRFGRALGLAPEQLLALRRGGVLHDIGKLGIPDRVLLKRGPLDDAEWTIMRTHPLIGDRLCASLRSLHLTAPIVRSHHERWDGSGYPDGLVGEQIPLLARVFQLCDIFDALTNARAYKPGMPTAAALEIMQGECDRGWRDPALMRTFRELVASQPAVHPPAVEHDDLGRTLFTAVVASGARIREDDG